MPIIQSNASSPPQLSPDALKLFLDIARAATPAASGKPEDESIDSADVDAFLKKELKDRPYVKVDDVEALNNKHHVANFFGKTSMLPISCEDCATTMAAVMLNIDNSEKTSFMNSYPPFGPIVGKKTPLSYSKDLYSALNVYHKNNVNLGDFAEYVKRVAAKK